MGSPIQPYGHSILNLDDESRNDHGNALSSYKTDTRVGYRAIPRRHRSTRNSILFADIPPSSIPTVRKGSSQTIQRSSSNRVKECTCYLRTVHDMIADGKTAYENIFDVKFDGALNPFGAKVRYESISSKDEARLYQFGKKVLPGMFMGYVLRLGR